MTGYADFEDFVIARRDALLRTAYLLTGDHHDAEDLVQSALVKVVPKWGRIQDRPEAYVRQVLARESVSRNAVRSSAPLRATTNSSKSAYPVTTHRHLRRALLRSDRQRT